MDHIRSIIEDSSVSSPSVMVMLAAARATRPERRRAAASEPLPKGARPKLTAAQAEIAASVVTRQMRRLGVAPHAACSAAGVAKGSNNYHRFHMTLEEMDGDGRVAKEPAGARRFAQSLGPYVDLCRHVARLAGERGTPVDGEALLAELATELSDYLAAFEGLVMDEYEAMAADIRSIGRWIGTGRTTRCGRPADAKSVLAFELAESMVFLGSEDGYVRSSPDGREVELPHVPLFTRMAAVFQVGRCPTATRSSGSQADTVHPETVQAILFELVSLALRLGESGTETVFVAQPWVVVQSYSLELMEAETVACWQGGPNSVEPVSNDEIRYGPLRGEITTVCDNWRNFVTSLPGRFDERFEMDGYREIEPDADLLRTWLGHRGNGSTIGFPFSAPTALKDVVPVHGEVLDWDVLPRLEEALYREESPLHELLLDRVAERHAAMEAFHEGRRAALAASKGRFRSVMRN